jgi:hypothetical protein
VAETETLTAEERDSLYKARDARGGYATRKALRLLDAHAAERAALVERAEKAEARHAAAEQNVLWLREQRERAEAELKSLLLGSYPAASKAAELVSRAESERNALAATLERVRAERDAAYGVLKHVRPGHLPSHVRPQLRSIVDSALAGAPAPEGETK